MKFLETAIAGLWIIDLSPQVDSRGFFASAFLRDEFQARGLEADVFQLGLSHNPRKGTLRGLHYQVAPHEETKVVRCVQGAAFDVLADVRAGSPTFGRWISIELSAANHRSIYVPPGVAHGYQTLADNTDFLYQISHPYHASATRGIRWDDPDLGIPWPTGPRIISERDQTLGRLEQPTNQKAP